MANEYYTETGSPSTGSSGSSSVMRSEFAAIGDGFDKLPTLNNNADKFVVVNSGGTALTSVNNVTARTNLGLGSIATQHANNVALTGGNITSLTQLSTNNAAITGGTISGTTITGTTGSTSTTFTFNGSGGTSSAVTVSWQKFGNFVEINVPAAAATTGTSSTTFTSDTALAAGARPASNQQTYGAVMRNNGAEDTVVGKVTVRTDGILIFAREGNPSWTNGASGGLEANFSFKYFVG